MTNTTLLIVDMSTLVGIFLLGLIAKIFPRDNRNVGANRGSKGRN